MYNMCRTDVHNYFDNNYGEKKGYIIQLKSESF